MASYDFSQLNDKEFEHLVADLISKREGVKFERFKPGRDKGVDARFLSESKDEIVVQCKHYLRSGLPRLIKEIKDKESSKVRELNPKRYIFATSL
jgi:hypothetical protein